MHSPSRYFTGSPVVIRLGRPDSGLPAHVLVSKYCDHLPLYRQSRIFARDGVALDRSTLAGWVGKAMALLEPLVEAIGRLGLAGPALFADDTPVRLLAPGTGDPPCADPAIPLGAGVLAGRIAVNEDTGRVSG